MKIVVIEKLNATEEDQAKIDFIVRKIKRDLNLNDTQVIVYRSHQHESLFRGALFVSLGGDGTALFAMKLAAQHDGSVISMNLGHLGFLADFEYMVNNDSFVRAIGEVYSGLCGNSLEHEQRSIIETKTIYGQQALAVNEFHLAARLSGILLKFTIRVNGQTVGVQKGDGVLISTPTGSTAYSLSVGGSIMSPEIDAIQVNVISPHTMTSRPLIVPMTSKIEVLIAPINEPLLLRGDGQIIDQITRADNEISYTFQKYANKINMWHRIGWNYYDVLAQKMLWWKQGA